WEFWAFFAALPDGSMTKAAISIDEDVAKQQAAGISEEEIARSSEARSNPRGNSENVTIQGYSLEIEKLNQILDSIILLRVTIRSALGSKNSSSDHKMAKRQKTALEIEIDKLVKAYEKKYQAEAMADFGF